MGKLFGGPGAINKGCEDSFTAPASVNIWSGINDILEAQMVVVNEQPFAFVCRLELRYEVTFPLSGKPLSNTGEIP